MKLILSIAPIIIGLVIGSVIATNHPNANAQGNPHQQQQDTVIIYTGIKDERICVYIYDASAGSPQFYDSYTANGRPLIPAIQILTALKKEGFRITHVDNFGYHLLERP